MVSRRYAAECRHALLHHLPGFIVQCIIIPIIKETVDTGKRPVNELLFHPFISLRIFPLKAHVDSHRLVCHGQSQCHHNTVILNVPHGLDTTLDYVRYRVPSSAALHSYSLYRTQLELVRSKRFFIYKPLPHVL